MHPTHPSLIAGALLGCALLPGCSAPEPSGDARPRAILVMSANLRWPADPPPNSWAQRRERIAALLRREAPDAVALQESRDAYVVDLLERLPAYAAYPSEGDRHNSILYRTDRLALDRETSDAENARVDAPAQDWGEGSVRLPRCARFVVVGTQRGFYLYDNHLDHRSLGSRTWSVGVLVDRVRSRRIDDPVVLAGDFNAPPDEETIAFLRGDAALGAGDRAVANPVPFVDTFRLIHPDEERAGTFHGYLGTELGRRVDYVFAGPGIRVLAARILRDGSAGRHVSDHYFVTATLELPE